MTAAEFLSLVERYGVECGAGGAGWRKLDDEAHAARADDAVVLDPR